MDYFLNKNLKKITLYLMLKEKFFNFILIVFIGMLFIYLYNIPPTIIVRHPNINEISNSEGNITYFEETEGQCK